MNLLTFSMILLGGEAAAELAVPSGQKISALEYLTDHDGQSDVLRARYHAPDLARRTDVDSVLEDMSHLCVSDALAIRAGMSPLPPRIIVSLSSHPVAFGTINADILQYFEAYRVQDNRCIWEFY